MKEEDKSPVDFSLVLKKILMKSKFGYNFITEMDEDQKLEKKSLHKDNVLQNPTRSKLLEFIRKESPINVKRILEKFEIMPGALAYHLYVLEEYGFILREFRDRVGGWVFKIKKTSES
jgi:DNA-binding transcriptional ArsR family regulator